MSEPGPRAALDDLRTRFALACIYLSKSESVQQRESALVRIDRLLDRYLELSKAR